MKNGFTAGLCSVTLASSLVFGSASAQEVVKIGMVVEMTGPFAEFGRQMKAQVSRPGKSSMAIASLVVALK